MEIAPPLPRSARQHQKEKKFLASLFFCGGDFFQNGKDIFLFGVLPSKYSGSVAGLQFGLGFAKTIFWGLDFRKTETNLFLDFVRAEEGSGEESARAFFFAGNPALVYAVSNFPPNL